MTNAKPKTINEVQAEAVELWALIGGAQVLSEVADVSNMDYNMRKLASEALHPVFEDLRRRADALANDIDDCETRRAPQGEAA